MRAYPAFTPNTNRIRSASVWWWLAAFLAAWILVIRAHWWEWSLNPQYSYGTLVPLLCLLLLGRRWADRPDPAPPSPSGRGLAVTALPLAVVILAALQPLGVCNADWRLLPAVAAACGVTMTLSAIYLAGGWPWLRHFAFPVLFFLVAVPWPRPQESAIMGWLMSRNTGFCVEALHWLGYAAEQRGNLIAIPGSVLGVEEACSGVRSLQSNIMIALAIGEFFRLTATRRVLLLLLGVGAALGGNAIRSLTLSVAACRSGSAAVDRIHDGTGLAVLLAGSVLILLAGRLLSRRTRSPSTPGRETPGLSARISLARLNFPLPATAAVGAMVLWLAASIGGEAWFRWHERQTPPAPLLWSLAPPGPDEHVREVPIGERTLDILLFPDSAYSEQWRDERGWQWQAFYFRWAPGPTSVQSAFVVHDPRVCLGAAGFELERKLPSWTAEAAGFRIPFQRYLFRDRGRPVHVFHTVIEEDGRPGAVDNEFSFDRQVRWNNLLEGRRNRGLRVLEFAVRGPQDPAAAEAAAALWLERRIAAEKPVAP